MIIVIIILSIVIIGLLIFNGMLQKCIRILINKNIDINPKEAMTEYFENNIEEEFPCTLLISIIDKMEFEGVAYDFSEYEEKRIIGMTGFYKRTIPEENKGPSILPNQTVLRMKDGEMIWDTRPFW